METIKKDTLTKSSTSVLKFDSLLRSYFCCINSNYRKRKGRFLVLDLVQPTPTTTAYSFKIK